MIKQILLHIYILLYNLFFIIHVYGLQNGIHNLSPISISVHNISWISKTEARIDIKIVIAKGWKLSAESQDKNIMSKAPEISYKESININTYIAKWPSGKLLTIDNNKLYSYTDTIYVPINIKLNDESSKAVLNMEFNLLACSDICLPIKQKLSVDLQQPIQQQLPKQLPKESEYTLFKMLLAAFLGGLLLNFMPCVIPVLGIKLKSISKVDNNTFKKIFLVTAFGIMLSFFILSMITIFFKYILEQEIGWGMQFQNQYFLSILIVALLLFGLSLLNILHLNTPKFLFKIMPKNNSAINEAFLSGIFAVLLSTPCCAPFMGAALGFALTRRAMEIILIFNIIGIGFAFPYIISAFVPINRLIPKPGKWSLYIEYFAGLLILASAIWLLFILSHIQSTVEQIFSYIIIIISIISILIAKNNIFLYYIPSLLFSAFILLPLYKGYIFNANNNISYSKKDLSIDLGKLKYEKWTIKAMNNRIKEGKIVFIDVTASWCISCKRNKYLIATDPDIQNILSNNDIVIMIADWTQSSDEITQFLKKYNRIGIPFNIIINNTYPNGIILSEFLTKTEIIKAITLIRKL